MMERVAALEARVAELESVVGAMSTPTALQPLYIPPAAPPAAPWPPTSPPISTPEFSEPGITVTMESVPFGVPR